MATGLLPPEPPLSEAATCILLSLVPMPRHGYAIMQEVRALSGGRVDLSTGTLYGALKRFLDLGWIDPVEPGDGSPARGAKCYRLTDGGRRALAAEVARLEELIGAARSRLVERPP